MTSYFPDFSLTVKGNCFSSILGCSQASLTPLQQKVIAATVVIFSVVMGFSAWLRKPSGFKASIPTKVVSESVGRESSSSDLVESDNKAVSPKSQNSSPDSKADSDRYLGPPVDTPGFLLNGKGVNTIISEYCQEEPESVPEELNSPLRRTALEFGSGRKAPDGAEK